MERRIHHCVRLIAGFLKAIPLFWATMAVAQTDTFVGPTTVGNGTTITYSYTYSSGNSNAPFVNPSWIAVKGSVNSTWVSGDRMTAYATVNWNATGSGSLKIVDGHALGPITITVITCSLGTPTSAGATPTSGCVGASLSLTATPGTSADAIQWFTASSGGIALATGTYATAFDISRTYYVGSYNTSNHCASTSRAGVAVTALTTPIGVEVVMAGPIHGSGTTTLYAEPLNLTTGETIKWYSAATGGSVLGTGSSYATPTLTATTTYYATSVDPGTSCEGPRSGAVAVVLPTGSPNVVISKSFKDTYTNDSLLFNLNDSKQNISLAYVDGLNRTIQQISQRATPAGKDIVLPIAYDPFGKTSKDYLPFGTTQTSGAYVSSFTSTLNSFYLASGDKIADDSVPYTHTLYESSPLGRVIEQGGIGANLQPGTSHTNRYTYSFNTSSDSVYTGFTLGTAATLTSANYLSRTQRTDPNGNLQIVFTNAIGQTVATKKQLDETINGSTVGYLITYYVYDDFGRVKYVIPPKATAYLQQHSWTLDTAVLNQLSYQFNYDKRGRLTEKKVPGQVWQYLCYDNLNRVVLTQDAFLRTTKQWIFIKYDRFGRPVMQGLYTNATQTTRSSVQAILDTLYNVGVNVYFERRGTTLHGYTNLSFPKQNADASALVVQTVNYYDNYDFDWNGSPDYKYDSTAASGTTSMWQVYGRPTGSKRLILGTSTWLYNYVFYDKYGRTIQSRSNNHLSTTVDNLVTVTYDFEKMLTQKTHHNAGTGKVTNVLAIYKYDTKGRLKRITQSNTASYSDTVNLAKYNYNELGQLIEKNLHYNGSSYLQSVDLRYSIQGWLSSINNSQLSNDSGTTNDDTNDYFGMELLYNTADGALGNTAKYNGNISAVKWKALGDSTGADGRRSYKFSYDKADKLKSATYQRSSGSSWSVDTGLYNESMTYDHGGNIVSLQRYQNLHSLSGTTVTSTQTQIDNLSYTYATGNQLSKVEDATGNIAGFNNGTTMTTEYTYDANGSLNRDQNKKISAIVYNYLGKPISITYANGKHTNYVYDASGSKLRVLNYDSTNHRTDSTEYVSNFVYVNNALSFFSSPEGRVVNNSGALEYQYSIADHQGNTRVLFSSVTPSATPAVATFKGDSNDNSSTYSNVNHVVPFLAANHTSGDTSHLVVQLNQTYSVGPAKSIKVFPGDKIDLSVWTYYEDNSGFGTSDFSTSAMITTIASAFGGVSGGSGESGSIYSGINNALTGYGLGGNAGSGAPAAYLNYILFDQDYKVMNMGWARVPTDAYFAQKQISIPTVKVTDAGYIFVYLSYEDESNNWVEFDDISITQTKSNVVQYNEYYPFGLQTQKSWTRDNSSNNFTGNGGSEMNPVTGLYDTYYRGFDPALGRFHQIDPKAMLTSDFTPYHFAGNNPVIGNDPMGDRMFVRMEDINKPAGPDSDAPNLPGGGSGFDLGAMMAGVWAMDSYTDIRPGFSGAFMNGPMQLALANGDISPYDFRHPGVGETYTGNMAKAIAACAKAGFSVPDINRAMPLIQNIVNHPGSWMVGLNEVCNDQMEAYSRQLIVRAGGGLLLPDGLKSVHDIIFEIKNAGSFAKSVNVFLKYMGDPSYGPSVFINDIKNWRGTEDISLAPDAINFARKIASWGHADENFGDNDDMRHVVGTFILAEYSGPGWANAITDANEYYGLMRFDIPNIGSRISGQSPWAFEPRDFFNNWIGLCLWSIYNNGKTK